MTYEVYLVLERSFDGDLWSLSRQGHVWLIKSPENEALAQNVWRREPEKYSALRGVTTFNGSSDSCETLYGVLGTIDRHHDERSATHPWDIIHVTGLSRDVVQPDRIAEALEVEAVVLEDEERGFRVKRGCPTSACT